jgi:hypothetical protein
MPSTRTSTKAVASKAGKTLSSSTSAKAKSAAAKTLAKRSAVVRKVHAAPKVGTVSRTVAKNAVKLAVARHTQKASQK